MWHAFLQLLPILFPGHIFLSDEGDHHLCGYSKQRLIVRISCTFPIYRWYFYCNWWWTSSNGFLFDDRRTKKRNKKIEKLNEITTRLALTQRVNSQDKDLCTSASLTCERWNNIIGNIIVASYYSLHKVGKEHDLLIHL